MTNSQRLAVRLSEIRQRLNEIAGLEGEAFTAEIRQESDKLQSEFRDKETQYRAAVIAEGEAEQRALETEPDAELRERQALRARASVGRFLGAALSGREVDGAEAELRSAAGIESGIPIELWDTRQDQQPEQRADASTAAPATVGVNLDRIRPAVFAPSILPRLGVEMPRVPSGTFASPTITTSLTAAAKAKGAAQESTAAAFTVTSATPKRVSARLSLRIEDLAASGQANFEAALRQNLSVVLADAVDDQGLNGDGTAPNLAGIFHRLPDPTAPGTVAGFDDFVATVADLVDGLWATTEKDVLLVVGPQTYRKAATTFRDALDNHRGQVPASAFVAMGSGGFFTHARMPAVASNVQQALCFRRGRSFMGQGAIRTAVCPHWGMLSIDDIYTGAASGERHFSMHVLLGDVILVQPRAYKRVAFKLA